MGSAFSYFLRGGSEILGQGVLFVAGTGMGPGAFDAARSLGPDSQGSCGPVAGEEEQNGTRRYWDATWGGVFSSPVRHASHC